MTDTLTAQELEFRLTASKGGNIPGITEDHRYEMALRLQALRAGERRAADLTTKMIDITGSALGTALLTWSIAFALSFFGFENGFLWMGAIALLWSVIGAGCVVVGGLIWIARHVRITIV